MRISSWPNTISRARTSFAHQNTHVPILDTQTIFNETPYTAESQHRIAICRSRILGCALLERHASVDNIRVQSANDGIRCTQSIQTQTYSHTHTHARAHGRTKTDHYPYRHGFPLTIIAHMHFPSKAILRNVSIGCGLIVFQSRIRIHILKIVGRRARTHTGPWQISGISPCSVFLELVFSVFLELYIYMMEDQRTICIYAHPGDYLPVSISRHKSASVHSWRNWMRLVACLIGWKWMYWIRNVSNKQNA